MNLTSIAVLLGFVAACFLAAMTGTLFRPGAWYERLRKPSWRPPNWLFAPVWTALYLTMACSGWLIWRTAGFSGAAVPLALFAVQLLLNGLWTPVFFGLHQLDLGFVVILALWLAIAATIIAFAPVNLVAGLLLVPYLAWVSFAAALNFAIWRLNRSGAGLAGDSSS